MAVSFGTTASFSGKNDETTKVASEIMEGGKWHQSCLVAVVP